MDRRGAARPAALERLACGGGRRPGCQTAEVAPTSIDARLRVRPLAAASGLVTALAGGCLLVAAVRTPGYGAGDYLSELGLGPQADQYRIAVLGAALGVGLLGGALRGLRLAAGLLAAGAALLVGSATVTCTPGCPLPPHNPATTVQDVLHAGLSVGALGLLALAMLAVASGSADRLFASASRLAGGLMVVSMGGTGAALLVQSEGLANGVLERVVLAVAAGWLLGAGGLVATRGNRISA